MEWERKGGEGFFFILDVILYIFPKASPLSQFRGVSFPSWRYKRAQSGWTCSNWAKAVVANCVGSESTLHRGERTSGKPGWEEECLFRTNSISYWLFPLLKYHMQDSIIIPCINKSLKANPEEASAYIGSDCETERGGSEAGQPW